MIKRELYMSKIRPFIDLELIKVLTGFRRSGKSVMLELIKEELLERGCKKEQFLSFNFERLDLQPLCNANSLHTEILNRAERIDGKVYLFFDEIQEVKDWEKCVNSLRVDIDCDIYITGSNAFLLSSEYSTYLSGRYVEIKTYPLSFREFLDFHGYVTEAYKTPLGEFRKRITDRNAQLVEMNDLFEAYLRVGGMPESLIQDLNRTK